MFSRILTTAVLAGAGAGLVAALLHLVFLQPVLLQAELYESGALSRPGADGSVSAFRNLHGFQPLRDGLTAVFTMLLYGGYALVAVALMSLASARGAVIDARRGILWGLAGFVAAQFAPGFSLAPEVPGAAAADLPVRQIWWMGTVAASAVALWLIAFGTTWIARGAAILLLLAPHLIGAPRPEVMIGPAPTEVGALFAARAFGVGMAAWVVLGSLAGHLWSREGARGCLAPQGGHATRWLVRRSR